MLLKVRFIWATLFVFALFTQAATESQQQAFSLLARLGHLEAEDSASLLQTSRTASVAEAEDRERLRGSVRLRADEIKRDANDLAIKLKELRTTMGYPGLDSRIKLNELKKWEAENLHLLDSPTTFRLIDVFSTKDFVKKSSVYSDYDLFAPEISISEIVNEQLHRERGISGLLHGVLQKIEQEPQLDSSEETRFRAAAYRFLADILARRLPRVLGKGSKSVRIGSSVEGPPKSPEDEVRRLKLRALGLGLVDSLVARDYIWRYALPRDRRPNRATFESEPILKLLQALQSQCNNQNTFPRSELTDVVDIILPEIVTVALGFADADTHPRDARGMWTLTVLVKMLHHAFDGETLREFGTVFLEKMSACLARNWLGKDVYGNGGSGNYSLETLRIDLQIEVLKVLTKMGKGWVFGKSSEIRNRITFGEPELIGGDPVMKRAIEEFHRSSA